jgi:heptaprenyl diphosphate synthase
MMALASEIMSECENTPDEALSVLADIPLKMCLGELKQLEIARDETRQTRDDYMKRISQKTAALIEGSCLLGGIAAGADAKTKKALSAYGHAIGLIFQLRDDLLDLELFPSDGKPVSQDAGRGYYTLPLLYALNLTSAASPSGKRLRALLRKRVHSVEDGAEIARLAKAAGGVRHTRQTMKREEAKALKALTLIPQNDGSTALKALTLALAADADADQ